MKFLYALTFLSLFSCFETTRNCSDYKTGAYYSEVSINGELFKSTFRRTENLQVETYNNKVDSSSLRWINDCEVIFKTINPKNMAERKDIHLKILTTTDTSYTYEYSYVGETKKQKGIAYRVN
ncbi:DNA topoisomerase IV [Aestuariibaculum suncheonense]|uniref:DNA topoisomerase IV n=1 Tax=Aestuariibaculum suncheonense TaxID=1028745 RepID=A0A8J6UH11_9FLAO|nr:DNA topoisomerase IV [Aestuariibaculum suncheonense]MBD0835499.1 DNA topoisomerase IV [Aestuariibaculum suncheonense]